MSVIIEQHRRADAFRRAELASFLRRKRETTRPQDVGLPVAGRRRTPGLRREEVAVLASVGISWYTWIEQGRDLSVSAAVLDSIARALRMTPGERSYLFEVAGVPAPEPSDPVAPAESLGAIQDLVDSIRDRPAYAVDRYWTVVAANRLANTVFDATPGGNCLVEYFTDSSIPGRYPFRELAGAMLVAQFREQSARFAGDPRFADIVDGLLDRSSEFRSLWDAHVVGVLPGMDLLYDHPSLGRLSFTPSVLTTFGGSEVRVFVYLPKPGTPTASSLSRVVGG